MHNKLQEFIDYLIVHQGFSHNTVASYKRDVEQFIAFATENNMHDLSTISTDNMLLYGNFLAKKHLTNSTIQRKYSALNAFFSFLLKINIITHNPITDLPRGSSTQKLPKYLNQTEIDRLLNWYHMDDALSIRNRLLLEMLYSTGMRASEIINLKYNTVKTALTYDKNNEYIFITVNGKGDKERQVPLRANALHILNIYLQSVKKNNNMKFLFQSNKLNSHIDRRTLHDIVKKAAIGAGLKWQEISTHTLRHSFATNLLIKGLDIREIQELLGHKNINTTSIYTKLNITEIQAMMHAHHPFGKME